MMTTKKYLRWIVLTNVLMALSINTTATYLSGGDTVAGWVKGCALAFTINTVWAAILPMDRIGRWFAESLLKFKTGSVGEFFARNFIVNAIYVTIISFTVALVNVGINGSLISVWFQTYPILHLVGLVTSLVIEKPVQKITLMF
jgi:hypothetical protein